MQSNEFNEKPRLNAPGALAPLAPPAAHAPFVTGATDQDGQLPLSHYVWLFKTHWLKMAAFIVFAVLVTAMVTSRIVPRFQSTATLYLDRNAAKNLVGQDSQSGSANRGDTDAYVTSQIALLKSDAVLRPVAQAFNLLAQPKSGSDVDKLAAIRRNSAPVSLPGLSINRPIGSYLLEVTYQSPDPNRAADIANAVADSYVARNFEMRINNAKSLSTYMTAEQAALKERTQVSEEKVAALEKELSLYNPEQKTSIVSAQLAQLTTQYTVVQASRIKAESVYNVLQAGTLDAALASPAGSHIAEDLSRLKEAQAAFTTVKLRYGQNSEEYKKAETAVNQFGAQVDNDIQSAKKQAENDYHQKLTEEQLAQKQLVEAKEAFDKLNIRMLDYQTAKQEATANRKLYDEMMQKISENQINASFQNDMVRVADRARPSLGAVYPRVQNNLTIAFFVSTLIALVGLVAMDRVDTTVRNPEQIAQTLKVRVIGGLPMMRKWRATPSLALLQNAALAEGSGSNGKALQTRVQLSGFEEAMRTLRNSIMLTDFDRRLKCILMTSASPSEGKSTVAGHLAIAHAEQGHKTLLIDGDMRRPSLHKLFGVENAAGLSKVLEYGLDWHDVLIKPRPDLELSIMPAGPSTRRAADLVGQTLPKLLDRAREEYDLVILDAPPLLGFPEPLQMAASVDGVIVVTRAGQTERRAVAAVLNTLNHLRANVIGLVLNEVRKEMGSGYHYYGYGYYGKNYGKYYSDRAEDHRNAEKA